MTKKTKIIISLILAVTFIACAVIGASIYQKNHTDNQTEALQSLFSTLASEQLQFDGSLTTNKPYYVNADFHTVTTRDKSKTKFTLKPSMAESSIGGELVNVDENTYIKLTDASKLISKLPTDPLNSAIKANLQSVAKQYQGHWIKLDQKNEQKFSTCLTSLAGLKPTKEQIIDAYAKYSFIEDFDYSKNVEVKTYHFKVNDKFDEFTSELAGKKTDCSLSDAQVELSTNDEGGVGVVKIQTSDGTLALTNIRVLNSPLSISTPKATQSFSDLKKSTDLLFIP